MASRSPFDAAAQVTAEERAGLTDELGPLALLGEARAEHLDGCARRTHRRQVFVVVGALELRQPERAAYPGQGRPGRLERQEGCCA